MQNKATWELLKEESNDVPKIRVCVQIRIDGSNEAQAQWIHLLEQLGRKRNPKS